MTPIYLYRLFSVDGTLLYVGVSKNPMRRFAQHRTSASWWRDVARARLEQFEARCVAMWVEDHAITHEHPLHNARGRLREGTSRAALPRLEQAA